MTVYGVNTPFFLHGLDSDHHLRLFVDRLRECGIRRVRLPFVWSWMRGPNDPLSQATSGKINRFLELLPREISVLAYIMSPPHEVATAYFDDREAIRDAYAQFCRDSARNFPRVREWEIWNEPNASDFYLSRRDKTAGHRPWSAVEFCEDVLLPGAKAIRDVRPNDVLCIGAVAEDGIVGHRNKAPALANRLPDEGEFAELRGKGEYDRFYFIPGFTQQLMPALRETGASELFDAIAFHPYPYFDIHHRQDRNIKRATAKHVADFMSQLEGNKLGQLKVWLTEFGARSLDISGPHFEDIAQQADYLEAVDECLSRYDGIERAYWYKLADTNWDLRQEKTFGLCDFNGDMRPVFHRMKALAWRETSPALPYFIDHFRHTGQGGGVTIDENVWDKETDSIFSNIVSVGGEGASGGVLLNPGRQPGKFLKLTSRRVLEGQPDADVSLRLDCQPFRSDTRMAVSLGAQTQSGTVRLRLDLGDVLSTRLLVAEPGAEETLQDEASTGAGYGIYSDGMHLSAVELRVGEQHAHIVLHFGSYRLIRAVALPFPLSGPVVPLLEWENTSGPGHMIVLRRFEARLSKPARFADRLPRGHAQGEGDWLFEAPAVSQIHQDEFVLRALRFKTGGYFVEIGGHDGVANSNTYLLERDFGWQGAIVEANPKWHAAICRNRNCVAVNAAAFSEAKADLEFVDAGAVGALTSHLQDDIHAQTRRELARKGAVIKVAGMTGDDILQRITAPDLIDYVSIDTEGSEIEVLKSISFDRWKIAILTIEHGGNEEKRDAAHAYLAPFGYERQRIWFEDWFVHPGHLARLLECDETAARQHMDQVWRNERYMARGALMQEGRRLREAGSHDAAIAAFREASKSYYPDNLHGAVAALQTARQHMKFPALTAYANEIIEDYPRHPVFLRGALEILLTGPYLPLVIVARYASAAAETPAGLGKALAQKLRDKIGDPAELTLPGEEHEAALARIMTLLDEAHG